MKEQIIKLMREHYTNNNDGDVQALMDGLDKLSEQEVRGVARLVMNIELLFAAFKKVDQENFDIKHAYDRFL